MELFGQVLQRDCLVVGLDEIEHRDQSVVLLDRAVLQLRELVDRDDQRVDGRVDDILVDADAPIGLAVAKDAHISHCLGGGSSRERVLFIGGQLVAHAKILLDRIAHRIQTSVSVGIDNGLAVAFHDRGLCHNAVHLAEMALGNSKAGRMLDISV